MYFTFQLKLVRALQAEVGLWKGRDAWAESPCGKTQQKN